MVLMETNNDRPELIQLGIWKRCNPEIILWSKRLKQGGMKEFSKLPFLCIPLKIHTNPRINHFKC